MSQLSSYMKEQKIQVFLNISEKTQADKKLKQIFEKLKQIIKKLNNLPTKNWLFDQKSPEDDTF